MSLRSHLYRQLITGLCLVGWLLLLPGRMWRRRQLARGPKIRTALVLSPVSAIGNLILLTPLFRNLRRQYPGVHITFATCRAAHVPIVIDRTLADDILFFDTSSHANRGLLLFAFRIRRQRPFDIGFSTFAWPTVLASLVLAVARCRYRVGYAENQRSGFLYTISHRDVGGHEIDRHLRLLSFVGQPLESHVSLHLSPTDEAWAWRFIRDRGLGRVRPLLGLHPGCDRRNALKRWPVERFVAVIRHVAQQQLADVIVFLGPDDYELSHAFSGLPRQTVVVQSESLARVAALIAACHLFLSNDSGLMHVAAALDVPVVAIFGPTSVDKNGPTRKAALLTATGVPCRPCHTVSPIRCSQERRYCLEGITVQHVVDSLGRFLTAPAALMPDTVSRESL